MKKLFLMAVFCLLAFANPVSAANYFSMRTLTTTPVNDTLRISPYCAGSTCRIYVTANFDGYLDHWFVQFTYPEDMEIYDVFVGSDMSIPYTRINGTDSVYTAILTMNYKNFPATADLFSAAFSSTSTVFGYWDSDGDSYYEQYGTVKWEPGFHNDMFQFLLGIPDGKTEGDINIIGTLTSTTDWRGVPTVNSSFNKTIHFKVAFLRGDANGDDMVNITDVTTITDWLIAGLDGVSPYKIAAADMDGNGEVNIYDVILLNDYIIL